MTENTYNLEFSEQLSMNIPDEEKMRLQDVYLFPDKHRDKLVCLLEAAISVIKEHEAELTSYAKEFELNPATISLHMSALLGAGLVKIEKENTRIYYSADKEAIARLLEFCEKTLL